MQSYGAVFAKVYNARWNQFARQKAESILPFISPIIEDRSLPKTLLDVCCGTGRFDPLFLEHGWQVTGIDLSPDMIACAQENNREYINAGSAEFSVADASSMKLSQQYSLVVSLYDAMNHLPSAKALFSCFQSVFTALHNGGCFVFDLNTKKGLLRWNGISVSEDDDMTIISRGVFDPSMDKAYTTLSGFIRNESSSYDRFSETVYNVAYDMEQIKDMLQKAGFRSIRMTDGSNFNEPLEKPEDAGRVFFIAER